MNLFSQLGPRFFSIFTSRSRELYAEALFVLADSYSPEEPTLRREVYARSLAEHFSSKIQEADFSDDEEFEENPDVDKVAFVIRKLRDTGWIIISQIENTFQEEIIVPDYAMKLIRTLREIADGRPPELRGRVYASYSGLKVASNDTERRDALVESYKNMELFSSELITIYTNLRNEFQKCLKTDDVNELLEIFLKNYQDNIVRRYIEPLSTINSAVRYRADIFSILSFWQADEEIMSAIAKEFAKAEEMEQEEAESRVFSMIDKIIIGYDNQIALINSIFERDQKYTQLATERISYKSRSGMDVKGILSRLMQKMDDEKAAELMSESLDAREMSAVDPRSLFERKTVEKELGESRQAVEFRAMPEGLDDNFKAEIESQITNEEIDNYVLSAMGDKDMIITNDFPLAGIYELVLFILATIRAGEKDAPYTMSGENQDEQTSVSGALLPALTVRRKKNAVQR